MIIMNNFILYLIQLVDNIQCWVQLQGDFEHQRIVFDSVGGRQPTLGTPEELL